MGGGGKAPPEPLPELRSGVGLVHSVCLTADVSGGLKSHSARGPGLISKDGGNASSAEDDGKVWRG
jgi:hypothetical protein